MKVYALTIYRENDFASYLGTTLFNTLEKAQSALKSDFEATYNEGHADDAVRQEDTYCHIFGDNFTYRAEVSEEEVH
jgi:hypothetical protein